jgi:hypothetical protein
MAKERTNGVMARAARQAVRVKVGASTMGLIIWLKENSDKENQQSSGQPAGEKCRESRVARIEEPFEIGEKASETG